jgi:hypothetical protein
MCLGWWTWSKHHFYFVVNLFARRKGFKQIVHQNFLTFMKWIKNAIRKLLSHFCFCFLPQLILLQQTKNLIGYNSIRTTKFIPTSSNVDLYYASKFTNLKLILAQTLALCSLWRMSTLQASKNVFPIMVSKSKSHKVKFLTSQTPLVNSYILNATLSINFAILCAICTKMELFSSSNLIPKHFIVYTIMKEFVIFESKRPKTPLSLIMQFTYNRFCPKHSPWLQIPFEGFFCLRWKFHSHKEAWGMPLPNDHRGHNWSIWPLTCLSSPPSPHIPSFVACSIFVCSSSLCCNYCWG